MVIRSGKLRRLRATLLYVQSEVGAATPNEKLMADAIVTLIDAVDELQKAIKTTDD